MASIKTIFTNIANAIREKKGTTEKYLPENMSAAISTIETGGTGIDTSDATATPNDILLDKTAYVNGKKIVGTIQTYNNEHENGYVQISSLKKFLDAKKSAYQLFSNYTGTSVDDLISYSDTENVTNMNEMFKNCQNLQTIPLLATSNVTTMNGIFISCANLQTIPQLDTSNVTRMENMFRFCTNLTAISQLNTSKVTNMQFMFTYCETLQTIPLLNTSNVTDMSYMVDECYNLQTIPQLNTSKVTDMSYMFRSCHKLQTISQLNTSSVPIMNGTFLGCEKLTTIDLTHMKLISASDSSGMCKDCHSLTKFIIRNMDKRPVLNSNAFNNCYHFSGTTDATYNPQGLKDGRIYVPDDYVDQLKQAPNWSAYADCIVPLSTLVE